VRGQKVDRKRFGWGIVAPCLLAALLIGLVVPFYTADDDDGLDTITMPVVVVTDIRPSDAGVPFVVEPAERAGAASVARREIERGPPRG
jgi:hypothetical protein